MEAPSTLKLIHNPIIALNMRYRLSHQAGQLQGNGVKIFTKYNMLGTEQYGFRVGMRTDNAIYKLTTEILNAMNNKLLVGGIFCDLEKVFDCVNHDILLSKLKLYGIGNKDFQLYQSYLGNRYCRKAICNDSKNSNKVSNWAKVRHEVPQGSILGLLLFLSYINDFLLVVAPPYRGEEV